mmetsp:Transcript_6463/g.10453  ORF Transcript_6463/g.10453 Transcript_6463/m.10453 type:complete len:90 (+) Transcript_6463:30-299(+)|eukprot:CAMPEP_0194664336 /NCGR_PEP_ID=MMETSP0295-20121207/1396_1 /TAXON_ID=39354 /ORGANISM="Heterosigma akashiwo, Strain CCMP2393" /LENGTH=89 /DNA_ID=CAMNT_0039546049 /DNA_START=12 /DNA_END=281 /DNA_ORIENTATION=-
MSKSIQGGKQLYGMLLNLQNYGVGSKVTRKIWHFPETFWKVTRVKLDPAREDGKVTGKAWGLFYWRGQQKGVEQKIRSGSKKQWELLER